MRSSFTIHIPQFAIWPWLGDYEICDQGLAADREPSPDETSACRVAAHRSLTWSNVQFAQHNSACVYCDHPISVGEAYCSIVIEGELAPLNAHYSCTQD